MWINERYTLRHNPTLQVPHRNFGPLLWKYPITPQCCVSHSMAPPSIQLPKPLIPCIFNPMQLILYQLHFLNMSWICQPHLLFHYYLSHGLLPLHSDHWGVITLILSNIYTIYIYIIYVLHICTHTYTHTQRYIH